MYETKDLWNLTNSFSLVILSFEHVCLPLDNSSQKLITALRFAQTFAQLRLGQTITHLVITATHFIIFYHSKNIISIRFLSRKQ